MKTACFVLRAQPFHLGHLRAIEWILRKYEKLIVIIGSSQESHTEENPFTFEERKEMIEKSLKSRGIEKERYEIIGIPDFHNDKAWVEYILKRASFDVVFTRNPWTKRCFESFKIPVKEHPLFGNTSGSKIREMIKKGEKWEKLVPKEVRKILKNIDLKERFKDKDTRQFS